MEQILKIQKLKILNHLKLTSFKTRRSSSSPLKVPECIGPIKGQGSGRCVPCATGRGRVPAPAGTSPATHAGEQQRLCIHTPQPACLLEARDEPRGCSCFSALSKSRLLSGPQHPRLGRGAELDALLAVACVVRPHPGRGLAGLDGSSALSGLSGPRSSSRPSSRQPTVGLGGSGAGRRLGDPGPPRLVLPLGFCRHAGGDAVCPVVPETRQGQIAPSFVGCRQDCCWWDALEGL